MTFEPASFPAELLSCQVQTPPDLAVAMATALGDEASARWLEPCVGEGRLLQAVRSLGVSKRRLRGLDLDPSPHAPDDLGRVDRGVDFLAWAQTTSERFDRVISNPPYLPLARFPAPVGAAAREVAGGYGLSAHGNSHAWNAFLLASLGLLREGGGICFLLPAAWDYAAYAEGTRELVGRHFERTEVYRSRTPLFADVQEGSVVLVGRGFRPEPGRGAVRRRDFTNPAELSDALRAGRLFRSSRRRSLPNNADLVSFGDHAQIAIGMVTGDSRYFLQTEDRRLHLGLPEQALRPVVSRARHLTHGHIGSEEWGHLRASGERVWLFHPSDDVLAHPCVRAYLDLAETEGGCRRGAYKVRHRRPWYRARIPSEPHGFMSGMTSAGPWIALNRLPGLLATNTLYQVRFRAAVSRSERSAVALSLLTSAGRASFEALSRRYADGLRKLEPGDVARLQVPTPRRSRGAIGVYRKAVASLLEGFVHDAVEEADRWFRDWG